MTSTGTRITGSVRIADGKGAIRIQDRYDTGIDDLWSALTDPRRLARWIGDVKGDLRLGGQFHARWTSTWDGMGRVDVCEPPRRLLVTMSPGEPDEKVIEARLTADGEQTVLVIEERGFPPDQLAAIGAGWQAHAEDLAAYLAGREPADWRSRWLELIPAYRDLAERVTLMGFLQAQRRSVLAIVEGLDDEGIRTAVVPSGWTPLGVVEHLGHAERLWFQRVLTGRAEPLPWPPGEGSSFTTGHPPAEVLDFYRTTCAISDENLSRTTLIAGPVGEVPASLGVADEIHSVRDIIMHMIEETARHAGHLDIARELIDGRTGLGPR